MRWRPSRVAGYSSFHPVLPVAPCTSNSPGSSVVRTCLIAVPDAVPLLVHAGTEAGAGAADSKASGCGMLGDYEIYDPHLEKIGKSLDQHERRLDDHDLSLRTLRTLEMSKADQMDFEQLKDRVMHQTPNLTAFKESTTKVDQRIE